MISPLSLRSITWTRIGHGKRSIQYPMDNFGRPLPWEERTSQGLKVSIDGQAGELRIPLILLLVLTASPLPSTRPLFSVRNPILHIWSLSISMRGQWTWVVETKGGGRWLSSTKLWTAEYIHRSMFLALKQQLLAQGLQGWLDSFCLKYTTIGTRLIDSASKSPLQLPMPAWLALCQSYWRWRLSQHRRVFLIRSWLLLFTQELGIIMYIPVVVSSYDSSCCWHKLTAQ